MTESHTANTILTTHDVVGTFKLANVAEKPSQRERWVSQLVGPSHFVHTTDRSYSTISTGPSSTRFHQVRHCQALLTIRDVLWTLKLANLGERITE
jgi:hypothetical protein